MRRRRTDHRNGAAVADGEKRYLSGDVYLTTDTLVVSRNTTGYTHVVVGGANPTSDGTEVGLLDGAFAFAYHVVE